MKIPELSEIFDDVIQITEMVEGISTVSGLGYLSDSIHSGITFFVCASKFEVEETNVDFENIDEIVVQKFGVLNNIRFQKNKMPVFDVRYLASNEMAFKNITIASLAPSYMKATA